MSFIEWLYVAFDSPYWWVPVGAWIVGGTAAIYVIHDILDRARNK